ncbi:hypothetical protein AWC11_17045 [Mycobacterium interjectum]|nr:hypothetical protein AWC11_17045 [Mycobacterium interjectum]
MAIDDEKFREILIRKFDLPADSDDAACIEALDNAIAKAAEAEVNAAINSGKILVENRAYWLKAFKANPVDTRKVLDSLTSRFSPQRPPAADRKPTADDEMARVHARITADPFEQSGVVGREQMDAELRADRQYHESLWRGLGQCGALDIDKPAEQFVSGVQSASMSRYQLVEHGDGTGHWETVKPDAPSGVVGPPVIDENFGRGGAVTDVPASDT